MVEPHLLRRASFTTAQALPPAAAHDVCKNHTAPESFARSAPWMENRCCLGTFEPSPAAHFPFAGPREPSDQLGFCRHCIQQGQTERRYPQIFQRWTALLRYQVPTSKFNSGTSICSGRSAGKPFCNGPVSRRNFRNLHKSTFAIAADHVCLKSAFPPYDGFNQARIQIVLAPHLYDQRVESP